LTGNCAMPTCLCPHGRAYWDAGTKWHYTTDHIIPRFASGPDSPDNIRSAHKACNSGAGAALWWASLTPEQRLETNASGRAAVQVETLRESGRRVGAIRTADQRRNTIATVNANLTPEKRAQAGKKGMEARTAQQRSDAIKAGWKTRRGNR